MDRYDHMALNEPWHDPAFRQAVKTHANKQRFLALCKKADAKGMKLSPNQQHLRDMLEKKKTSQNDTGEPDA